MKRRVAVVTGTRAEFGLLRWLMEAVKSDEATVLQVVATGMHLSPEFGLTYREIESAGFSIDAKVEMLMSADTATGVTKSIGLGVIGFADAFARLQPDVIVVLGDRFEIFAAVTAALIARIPVAHLHGGETTEGAFDEAIRHSITKMSHLHFVAAQDYRNRVVQLGEHPEHVFVVGGLGIDAVKRITPLPRTELEASIGFRFRPRNLLVTFHPVTLNGPSSAQQMSALLDALDELEDTGLIFTMPNADTGGRELSTLLRDYVASRPHACVHASLGHLRYLSCMHLVDGVVGNSSSGLTEAPSLGVATIDIGERQKGRLAARSVVHCEPTVEAIRSALRAIYLPEFRASLKGTVNPYGNGGASEKIAKVLLAHPLTDLIKKSFYDLPATVTCAPDAFTP